MDTEETSSSGPTDITSVQLNQDNLSSDATNPTGLEQSSGSSQTKPSGALGSVSRRKRKTPASVTPNACTNCQKARAKCDGKRPACKRCASRNITSECHYEPDIKAAKAQLLREIQRLKLKTESLAEEKEALEGTSIVTEQIISSLKENGHAHEIIKRLKNGDTHETIALWLQNLKVGVLQSVSPASEQRLSQAIARLHQDFSDNPYPLYWTSVAKVPALVDHLISLYLCWVHPAHMLFDETHFLRSFRTCTDIYCSASLVNVICAMACHLLHETFGADQEGRSSMASLRDQFMDETKFWMQKDLVYDKMTTIQTYAIMFLVELGCGKGLLASSHLRLAVENLLAKQKAEQSSEAEEITTFGIVTLHTAWSGFTYQKPSAPVSTQVSPLAKLVANKTSGNTWRVYKRIDDETDDEENPMRPDYALEVASEHAKLFRIVHETILSYCGSRGKVSAKQLLKLYKRYIYWKDNLPPEIAAVELSVEPMPHVLFLHVQYYTALVHFFQPLLHALDCDQETQDFLRGHLLNHARSGLTILDHYQSLYSNHYIVPLYIFSTVHICDALVRYDSHSPSVSDLATFCLRSLETMRINFPVAGCLQQIFHSSIRDMGIPIPDNIERRLKAHIRLNSEEILNACTRSTYRQPVSQISTNLERGIAQSFVNEWEEITKKAGGVQQKQMDIQGMLN